MDEDGEYHRQLLLIFFTTTSFDYVSLAVLLVILLCLFLSAMVSGSEVAFFSLNAQDEEDLKDADTKEDERILHLKKDSNRLLATILVSNNIFNVAIVILSYFLFQRVLNFENIWIERIVNVGLITFILVLFGEIIPKLYARANRLAMARRASGLLNMLSKITYPLSILLVGSTNFVQNSLQNNEQEVDIEELEDAIDLTTSNEDFTEDDSKMLKGILNFGNINAKQVMKSRVDMIAIDFGSNFKALQDLVIDSGFSRIPVFKGDLDHIEGIIYAKDMLEHIDKNGDFKWQNLIRDSFFIPETKKIDDLLKEFQRRRIHQAIVVDEYGGTSGLITLEDVVEQVIGEIHDEFDDDFEFEFERINSNTFAFEGKTLINDICKVLEVDVDEFEDVRGESDSLAGLILEINERIPAVNEVITFEHYVFNVLAVNDNRIEKVQVTIT